MKSFRFRLQTVLEQRQRIETQAMSTYAEAVAAEQRATTLLVELQEVHDSLVRELSTTVSDGFDANVSRTYHDYLKVIKANIKEHATYTNDLVNQREALKLSLVRASQNHQALASVKQKHKDVHRIGEQRKEQNAIDEMAGNRFAFRSRSVE